jgi:DNA-binding winged helix-turn-helix (wHTH) protein
MSSPSYVFGEFLVDPASREVWRDGQLIALPPQVFDCLTYLIERRDRAVGRDELVAAVWGKTEISDTQLGQTILRIRREFGDDAKEQRVLRTIPRFGYRWVAPVEIKELRDAAENHGVSAQAVAPSPAQIPTRPSRAKLVVSASAVVLLIAIGIGMTQHYRAHVVGGATKQTGDESLTSAVLPATVESSAEWGWMRLGVMDVVASRLRSSGVPSVPSEEVVALLNAPAANRSGSVRDAIAARLLISPSAHRVDSLWQVELDADDGAGQHYATEARARDVTEAARQATDKLLAVLGRQPTDSVSERAPYAALIKRLDAAILADDPDSALALIEHASVDEQQSPEVRLLLAKIDFRAGKLEAAHARLLRLLDEAPAQTQPVLRASILNGLGAVAVHYDKPQEAEKLFSESIELLASRSEPAQLGQAYLGRAAAAADQNHFESAAADYARARIALRQANDTLALIRVAANEGFMDMQQDRPAQALPQLVAATDGFKKWGALNEAIFTYIGQINCYLALLDGRSAMQAADAAAILAQRIDNPSTLASLAIARARSLAAVGRLHEARDVLDRLRSGSKDEATIAVAGVVLARIELESNNAAAAGDLAERAVSALTDPSYAGARADAWLIQVRAALHAADAVTKSSALVTAFDAWAGTSDERRAHLLARLASAENAHRFGEGNAWRAEFESARQLAEHGAVPAEIAIVARSYADALMVDGDLAAAEVEVGRVSRWSDQDFACAVLEARLYAALGRNEARQTALARARALAGERGIPADVLAVPISVRAAAQ